jgi:phosphohistidine phosphatase SixA
MINRRVFLASMAGLGIHATWPRSLSALGAAPAGPAEVLIMRHAEEPPHGRHLNDRGRARAAALGKLFPARFALPTALFATRPTKDSARSTETLEPLAAGLQLRIDESFQELQYRALAETILTSPAHAGGHVLVCWHRDTMTNLAAALGVVGPPRWPAKQYDHVWQIRYPAGRATLIDERA